MLSLYTNSNHSPRLSQGALFRQDMLCECVCVCFRLCVAMNAVFVTLLALPRAWITSLQEEKEGNGELREEKKRRCVTERKKEPLMKSEVRERIPSKAKHVEDFLLRSPLRYKLKGRMCTHTHVCICECRASSQNPLVCC